MKLIGTNASPYTRKARVVAAEKKIEYEYVVENPWPSTSAVPAHNPLGKVPVLVLEDGTTLYDSRVIAEYLDGISPVGKLIPGANRERIEVKRWEALADGVLDAAVLVRLENQREANLRSQAWIDRQMSKASAGLAEMDKLLGSRAWCAGTTFTLADIAVGVCLGWLDYRYPQLDWRASCPALAKLTSKLAERPSFVETVPKD